MAAIGYAHHRRSVCGVWHRLLNMGEALEAGLLGSRLRHGGYGHRPAIAHSMAQHGLLSFDGRLAVLAHDG